MASKAKKTLKTEISHQARPGQMQIISFNMPGGRMRVDVKVSDTIADVKTMIANGTWGILENDQTLRLRGRRLKDCRTLSHYNIENKMVLVCYRLKPKCDEAAID